ncbi:hypothetical protein D770_01955 [Flammeovirgaceae bacterium 311]|nr:hypothetical protein D770_01955 [Flammeovirgaceae bacterium 311]
MAENLKKQDKPESILTQEQDAILDMYLKNLDNFFESIKQTEKVQVEIETLHLKRILSKNAL